MTLRPEDDEEIIEVDDAPPPRDEDRIRIVKITQRLIEAENEVDRCTRALREALETYRTLAERELPEAITATGLDEYKLEGGNRVSVKRRYFGSKLTNPEGLAWVTKNGGEALIRAAIRIELPVAERNVAQQIFTMLKHHPAANRFVKLELEESVNPMTLSAFVREAVEQNLNPPLEKLGVVRRVLTRIAGNKLIPVELKGFERASLTNLPQHGETK